MTNEEFLQHYGVLGMHWGKRSSTATKTVTTVSHPHTASEDHIKKVSLKGKKIHEMTNAELKALNERMNLEKQYKDLSKGDISKGKKFVQSIIGSVTKSAQDAAMEYLKKQATKKIEDMLKKTAKTVT